MGNDIFGSLEQAIIELQVQIMQLVPQFIMAFLVLVAGWIIAGFAAGVVRKLFKTFKINEALDKAGLDELSNRAGYHFKPGHFAGALVKWFLIIAFAIVSFDILGLQEVTFFMREVVLGYLPQVFAAALILFVGVLVANLARNVLVASLQASGTQKPGLYGKLTYALVIAFTIMAILNQLQIADELVQTLFMGIVFALSLGAGLAFGLGGKDAAGKYIDQLTRK